MTIRTGKGGRYRYYACNNRINKGLSTCRGLSIRMDHLDALVMHELESRICRPDRIKALLAGLLDRQRNRGDEQAHRGKELRQRLREAEAKIGRLLDAVEEGLVQETDLVRDRLAKLEQERAEVLRLIASLDRRHTVPAALLSGSNLSAFTHAFTERLHSPNSSLRKAYIRQLVDRVEVGQSQIRIKRCFLGFGARMRFINCLYSLGENHARCVILVLARYGSARSGRTSSHRWRTAVFRTCRRTTIS
jgi:site-specific DNA recombinase